MLTATAMRLRFIVSWSPLFQQIIQALKTAMTHSAHTVFISMQLQTANSPLTVQCHKGNNVIDEDNRMCFLFDLGESENGIFLPLLQKRSVLYNKMIKPYFTNTFVNCIKMQCNVLSLFVQGYLGCIFNILECDWIRSLINSACLLDIF